MAKKEFIFDTKTLSYKEVKPPLQLRIYRVARKVLIGFLLASLFNFLFSYFFYTPKMVRLSRENRELRLQYKLLEEKIETATHQAQQIKKRDHTLYRSLFAADTITLPHAYLPYSLEQYNNLWAGKHTTLMTNAWESLDHLASLIYVNSVSLDELQKLSIEKDKMSSAIPSIWPIDKRSLRGRIGAFGGRNHPILRRYHQHTGIDLAGAIGTKIYATADGLVVLDSGGGSGYGIQILIDHGFGYKTRYAHLSRSLVKQGQYVKRGEIIGQMGSTGRSTGSHLHYEVIYKGIHVDPINYIRKDMSASELESVSKSLGATTYEGD